MGVKDKPGLEPGLEPSVTNHRPLVQEIPSLPFATAHAPFSTAWVMSCSPSPIHLHERASRGQEIQREPDTPLQEHDRRCTARATCVCLSAACSGSQVKTQLLLQALQLAHTGTFCKVSGFWASDSLSSVKGSQQIRDIATLAHHSLVMALSSHMNSEFSSTQGSRQPLPTNQHWLSK